MIRFLLAIGVLAAATLGTGCGATSGPGAQDQPVRIASADDGRTITVPSGTTIELTLENSFGPPGSSLTWDAVSSDSSIVTRMSTRVDPAQPSDQMLQGTQRYVADFRALASGQAQIIGHGRRTCEAMNPAFCSQAGFTVTVQVTG